MTVARRSWTKTAAGTQGYCWNALIRQCAMQHPEYAQIDGADPEISLPFAVTGVLGARRQLRRVSNAANYFTMPIPIQHHELTRWRPFSAHQANRAAEQIESNTLNVANEQKGGSASDPGVCDFFRTERVMCRNTGDGRFCPASIGPPDPAADRLLLTLDWR